MTLFNIDYRVCFLHVFIDRACMRMPNASSMRRQEFWRFLWLYRSQIR